jgi:N-sulfoglucosamine sulfohydrolase
MKPPSAFIRWLVSIAALLCAIYSATAASTPNVVLYVCDDWGRDAGCFGNPVLKTPHIDQLARDGTRFERAYCTTASCSASRSVILTGLHNHLNGQYGHQHDMHHFSAFPSVRSLPVLLSDGGYRTARVGKFHVAPDDVFRFENVFKANSRNGVAMAEACRDWFGARDERPFFLYICTSDPHRGGGVLAGDPAKPDAFGNNAVYRGINEIRYDPKDVIVPPWLPDTPECRAEIAQYYQSVSRVDQGVGHLVQMLKELGLYDNTLIMLTSDNGMAFPGSKTNLYEPGMHLPLIVRAPAQKQRGGTCDAMVSWVDFTPTILEFCGVSAPDAPAVSGISEDGDARPRRPQARKYSFHGRSWAGLWDKEKPTGWDEVYASHTFHEITMYYPMRVVETRQHKLILNLAHQLPFPFASDLWASATWQSVHRRGGSHYGGRLVANYLQRPRYELYDKEKDPQEFKNVVNDLAYAQVFEQLSAKLKAFQRESRDPWVVKYEHE